MLSSSLAIPAIHLMVQTACNAVSPLTAVTDYFSSERLLLFAKHSIGAIYSLNTEKEDSFTISIKFETYRIILFRDSCIMCIHISNQIKSNQIYLHNN